MLILFFFAYYFILYAVIVLITYMIVRVLNTYKDVLVLIWWRWCEKNAIDNVHLSVLTACVIKYQLMSNSDFIMVSCFSSEPLCNKCWHVMDQIFISYISVRNNLGMRIHKLRHVIFYLNTSFYFTRKLILPNKCSY